MASSYTILANLKAETYQRLNYLPFAHGGYSSMGPLEPTSTSTLRQMREKRTMQKLFRDGSNQTASSSKLIHAQTIEPLTVSELNQSVLTADPQIIEFLCTAKVTGIQSEKGGVIVAAMDVLRRSYHVELSLADQTDDALFVAFDMEMVKLINIQTAEAAQITGVGANARVDAEMTQFVAGIVGKIFTFQLKLGEFNFTSKHQTFTISRIITKLSVHYSLRL
ncbi:unnamed protein product [Brassica rapa]|uniref:Uncharacterized protein n=2 Tax=Brassica TaxID=3705 RepID=A0A3P6CCJ8_BRACM|nr:unnamed protein product [Brassica napus]CAG7906163.1 unnamed protein product [Brassica rapa]VDD11788.1 unnamed protein product [Brassica rapa]